MGDVGGRLKALIERKGYRSVSAAAKACDLSRTQLWDIIHDRKSPRADTLERIVGALGGTMKDFYRT